MDLDGLCLTIPILLEGRAAVINGVRGASKNFSQLKEYISSMYYFTIGRQPEVSLISPLVYLNTQKAKHSEHAKQVFRLRKMSVVCRLWVFPCCQHFILF